MTLLANTVIDQGNIAFGTSGARGLVDDFTPAICSAFSLAFLSADNSYSKVAIGIDNRPSSLLIAAYCIRAAQSLGLEIAYYGVLPTPALALQAMSDDIPCIMVTGSHIPFDRNGLKFYTPQGEITKLDEAAILSSDVPVDSELTGEINEPNAHLPPVSSRACDTYIARYTSVFDSKLLANKRIGIFEHSSAGRDLYPTLFEALGAEVISLGRSDEFVPIDTEAVAKQDIEQAMTWSEQHQLDAVFSTDGDGDRPLLSDEHGVYLRGDILCLLAAKALNIESLAVPVSCNSAIELTQSFEQVIRTKIGSPYVIEAMQQKTSERIAGFEANGGFLLGSEIIVNQQRLHALPTRDAVLPVLAALTESNSKPMSEVVADLPQRITASDRIKQVPSSASLEQIAKLREDATPLLEALQLSAETVHKVDETDGLRLYLSNDCVVHLRPSGNAPELRCYTEADNEVIAQQLLTGALGYMRDSIG